MRFTHCSAKYFAAQAIHLITCGGCESISRCGSPVSNGPRGVTGWWRTRLVSVSLDSEYFDQSQSAYGRNGTCDASRRRGRRDSRKTARRGGCSFRKSNPGTNSVWRVDAEATECEIIM